MLEGYVDSLYAASGFPLVVVGVIAIALGLLESFLGYRIFKVQVAVVGFFAGFSIGISAFGAAFGILWLSVLLGALLGVLLAWLAVKIYKAGVFLLVGAFAYLAAIIFVPNFWFALIVAVAAGLLGVFLTKPVIIIATAFGGGGIAAGGLAMLIWGSPQAGFFWLRPAVMLALGVFGLIVQFRANRGVED